MERVSGRERKQGKSPAKKAIKVVCISNPMKFKTSASDFRALVQKLTGRDSDTADIISRYHPIIDDDVEEPDRSPESSSKVGSLRAGYVCPLQLLDGAFSYSRTATTTTTTTNQEEFPWLTSDSSQGCEVWGSNED